MVFSDADLQAATEGAALGIFFNQGQVCCAGSRLYVQKKDFDNVVATLNFAGNASETQQFTVATLDDLVLEGTETFNVSLNASDPLVADSDTAVGTINDNDAAAVTVDDVIANEGTGLTFTVTLDNAVAGVILLALLLLPEAAHGRAPVLAPGPPGVVSGYELRKLGQNGGHHRRRDDGEGTPEEK